MGLESVSRHSYRPAEACSTQPAGQGGPEGEPPSPGKSCILNPRELKIFPLLQFEVDHFIRQNTSFKKD
jgi:hypothetical protein